MTLPVVLAFQLVTELLVCAAVRRVPVIYYAQ